ncbi:MAG: LysM peptidoglycan-binding domain-containing protein [Phycisphaera sp.]|nr:LysM peptidoglycan-binding domain-containing protein [Phycisphaera sp.]
MNASYKLALGVTVAVLGVAVVYHLRNTNHPDKPPITDAPGPNSHDVVTTTTNSNSTSNNTRTLNNITPTPRHDNTNPPTQTQSPPTITLGTPAPGSGSPGSGSPGSENTGSGNPGSAGPGNVSPASTGLAAQAPGNNATQATPSNTTVSNTAAPPTTASTYTIQQGDTLTSIALKRYGSERYMVDIAQANPLVDPTRLKIGQVIKLPTIQPQASENTPPTSDDQVVIYSVRSGDTLSTIAKQYYGNTAEWSRIYQANRSQIGSNPDRLSAGMKLVIPPAE